NRTQDRAESANSRRSNQGSFRLPRVQAARARRWRAVEPGIAQRAVDRALARGGLGFASDDDRQALALYREVAALEAATLRKFAQGLSWCPGACRRFSPRPSRVDFRSGEAQEADLVDRVASTKA